jgi:hypothetical protein
MASAMAVASIAEAGSSVDVEALPIGRQEQGEQSQNRNSHGFHFSFHVRVIRSAGLR